MKRIKKILGIALAATLSLGMGACSQGNSKDNAKVNKKDGNLKIVATSDDYKKLFDKFTEETGIKTEYLSMSSGEVISRIEAEGNKPMADFWFGGGVDAFMKAKDKGLLEQCEFDGAEDISSEFKDNDNYWFSKGLTVVGFIVNKDILQEKKLPEPKTWKDLSNPIYKDEVAMSNPAVSGTNYAVVNGILQNMGNEEGWKYLSDLNKNIPFYDKRGADPWKKVVAGERAIGITYLDTALEGMEKEKNVKLIYPEDGIPWMPDGVAVFKNATNLENAKTFLQWVYKDENLKQIVELDKKGTLKLVKPNLQGVELTIDNSKLLKQDLSLFGSQRTEILDKWNKLVGDK